MEAVDGESAVRGLLVTLLNLFNVDSGSTLSRLEFTAGAAALGYDISDEKWAGLYKRFAMANAPDDEDHEVEELDLSLLGERFRAMYDPLLEALLRQTLRGLIFQSARISKLEESLDSVMNAGERDRNSKIQRVMNRFRNGLLTTTLDAWKSMVAQTRELKGRVARMWSNRLLAAVWQQWQEATAEGRGRRQKLANAVGILKNRQIAMAFACWVELLDDARRRWAAAERALARMRNALVAGCWVSWVEAVIRSKEQREALGRVAARLQNRAMAQAFDGWTGMVAEVKWQREAVSSVLGRLRNRELAAAFDAWHEAASGAASAREEALRRAGAMLTNRTLLLAFEAWREAVASKHALLDRARQLAGRWLHALCGRCFDAWAEAAERQRRIFRQAAHAIGPGRLLWLAYSTWKASVKEAVAERERERMQSEITSSVASGLGGKLSGQHAELAAQLEAQLSRQLEQQLAAQLAAQLDERLEVRMQHSLPEGLAAQLDERVTSQLASLHSVVVTEGSSHREAMEAIKRKVDHLHIHLPSQLERKVSDDVAHEVAEAMRRAAQEVARQEKALEEAAEIRRQEEEKQRQAKLVKERQRREEGLRRRVANRLANRGLSTCFYAWADDVRQQVQARAAKRVRDEAEEGARRQIEAERESLQEEFLARLRAAGAAWFDESALLPLTPTPPRPPTHSHTPYVLICPCPCSYPVAARGPPSILPWIPCLLASAHSQPRSP